MKMSPWVFATVIVAGMLAPGRASGQFIPAMSGSRGDTATISAIGTGEVVVPPARAILYVQIVTDAEAAGGAATENGTLRTALTEQLAELGIGTEQVTLWGYGAGPAAMGGRTPNPCASGGEASHEAKSGIRVVVEPVARLDQVATGLLMAGASSISMVQFEGGESEDAQREAARIAVSQARSVAESIAEAAGGRLGDLVNLTVIPDYNGIMSEARYFQGAYAGQGVQLYPSDVTVKAQVHASWVFEGR